ncbi:Uncharacterized conserved protein YlxW, UPF0749 family [Nakamurella panacisegetis]|uniref:Uncharacterized conserved protein YlxW, UPF0749 family n=1 Tax=Nakamurella panacisegetis TaxID=1090615 RepID=A0A1H0KQW9_9ACTN|nr:DUF881 domain-containing protein [Nakamurella panacisegetis]SDO58186.1 Uncharacterized conserved protein YlxW, UPF0749 family [Nakamurella panacisegetis]
MTGEASAADPASVDPQGSAPDVPKTSGRRAGSSRRAWKSASIGVFLVAGALLGTARSYSHGEDIRNRSVDLSVLVKGAGSRVDAAQARAASLQSDINALAGSDVSPQVAKARQRASALAGAAGLTAVKGPALRVSLSDAQRDSDGNYPAGVAPDDLVVHQQDVQSVVNALWAGGAEAMMIMDQRVVTTSAVRCIGNTLLLQGRTYSPPFVITAIGDATKMSRALDTEPGVALFQTYVQKFQLGFEIDQVKDVTLPAYAGLIRMTAAHQETK